MGSKLNRHAYEALIEEDVARVEKEMPDSLEREHVILVLRHSVECYYPSPGKEAAAEPTTATATVKNRLHDLARR